MKTIKTEKYDKLKKEAEEDNIEKNINDFYEKTDLYSQEWKDEVEKNIIPNVFDNLNQIKGFKILKSNPRSGRHSHEPQDGTIKYNEKEYYFKFSHEFDEGNSYIVYENNNPVFYFLLWNDFYGDIGSPMLFEPEME